MRIARMNKGTEGMNNPFDEERWPNIIDPDWFEVERASKKLHPEPKPMRDFLSVGKNIPQIPEQGTRERTVVQDTCADLVNRKKLIGELPWKGWAEVIHTHEYARSTQDVRPHLCEEDTAHPQGD